MGKDTSNNFYFPENTDEAIEIAVAQMLKAATNLCLAADMSEEATKVDHYVNAALHLRDIASAMTPEEFSFEEGGAEVYDFRTKARLN